MATEQLSTLIGYFLTVIAGIIAAYQAQKKTIAQTDLKNTVAFYDPSDETVLTAPALQTKGVSITGRSHQMDDETKKYLISGFSPEMQGRILQAVATAEEKGYVSYVIPFNDQTTGRNGYFIIEYGLLKGGSYHESLEQARADPRLPEPETEVRT